jgi:hypothetical protein
MEVRMWKAWVCLFLVFSLATLAVLIPWVPARASNITQQTGGSTTNQNIRPLGATFVNGGAALSGTQTICQPVFFSGTIQQVDLIGDQSGNVTVDVRTVPFASYTGPGSASTITAADTPALSSAVKLSDSTLTGWTTSLSANTVVCYVMSSPATVTFAVLQLKVAAN